MAQGQGPEWPTPPPAPPQPPPRVASPSEIVPIDAPLVPGATTALILPLAPGGTPWIPPVRSTSLETQDGVRLVSQAGTLQQTLQLAYRPVELDSLNPPGPHLRLLKAFEIRSYDYKAKEISPALLRPWILEVSLPQVTRDDNSTQDLLIARWEQDRGWLPLITDYHRDHQLLVARVLHPGLYAILQDSLVALP